ncbi:MAG: hypothetical protein JWR44_1500 [Hymenobacter sp.]|nr:hypothetical protein [Hymenobacter sp.]
MKTPQLQLLRTLQGWLGLQIPTRGHTLQGLCTILLLISGLTGANAAFADANNPAGNTTPPSAGRPALAWATGQQPATSPYWYLPSTPSATITAVATTTNVSCYGGNDGAITLTVSGGVAPYTFQWSNGATTQNLTGLSSGSYSVVITDATGVSDNCTCPHAVGEPAQTSVVSKVINATCASGGTGGIALGVSGGTGPYSYLWSNGATTQSLTGVVPGTYSVVITDAHGCTSTFSGTVQSSTNLLATPTAAAAGCYGSTTGSIALAVSGGQAPYSFLWSNGAITQNLSGVAAGTYSVAVTDALGCSVNGTATVLEPAQLRASASPTGTSCAGGASGSVTLAVTGGTAPFTYLWSNGATTQNLSNVAGGPYSVTVTDANGCSTTGSATVAESVQLLAAASKTDASCANSADGAITLALTGGVAPFTFLWSNGATSQNLSGLMAGTYSVTVTDARGCTATAQAAVGQPANLRASATGTDATCFGSSNGTVTLTVAGGTAPYTFLWANGATTQNLTGVGAGTYSVTVTDAHGCSTGSSAAVGQPALLAASASAGGASCAGGSTGSVTLTVSGGTAPFTYLWSNGVTTQNLSGLMAGTYSVTVTDAAGCTASAQATVGQATVLTAVASKTDASCYGTSTGSASVAPSGGTAPYTYLWSNGATSQSISGLAAGTYSVVVTDASGCTASCSATVGQPALLRGTLAKTDVSCYDASNGTLTLTVGGGTAPFTYNWGGGVTTQNRTGLAAGTYTVTITDANGCSAAASATIGRPAQLQAVATAAASGCSGGATGSVSLAVTGGTAPFTYLWSNGITTQNLSGVAAGTYSVAVTDARGCTASCSATVGQGLQVRPTATPTAAACCNGTSGSVALTVTGGTAPYTYLWSNGMTTQNLSNVAAGTYSVTVTDSRGCTGTASATVTQPAQLRGIATATGASCCNATSGSVDLTITGGTAPFTYHWSNGRTTQDLSGVGAGTYSVTITDARGCTTTASATVTQPTQLRASATATQATCTSANGKAMATATGGTAPYSYLWSPGSQTGATATGLSAGTYSVRITDARGCTALASVQVTATNCTTQHCTLTQGGYGNGNGIICKEPSKRRTQLIADMLTSSNVTVGVSGRSLTYTYTAGTSSGANSARLATAQCIIAKMPGGGTPSALPSSLGNANGCSSSFPTNFLRNGRFNNVLLSQTLTLTLNTRLDNSLAALPLSSSMTSYATLNCSSQDPSDLDGITASIPASVLANLNYQSGTATVGSLLALANKALGGATYANGGGCPSLSDINCAVTAINELFDDCRMFDPNPNNCSRPSFSSLEATPPPALVAGPADSESLAAAPNPFATSTELAFTLPQTASYTLLVYDLKGSVVARVSTGQAEGGVHYDIAVGEG